MLAVTSSGARSTRASETAHGGARSAAFPLFAFVAAVALLQVALVPSALFPVRTALRAALYGSGLVMLCLPLGRSRPLPVTVYAYGILVLMGLGLLNPETNSTLGGLASILLNLAILSPIFWVPRVGVTVRDFQKLVFLLWAFHAASTGLGILETLMPAQFSRESQIAANMAGAYAEGLKVTLADGTRIYRPMGLTDTPGGAASSGMFACLYGAYHLLRPRQGAWRLLYLAGIGGGLFCIYVCQVRSLLILTAICVAAILAMVIRRGEANRVAGLALAFALLGAIATFSAFAVGGSEISKRYEELGEGSAAQVYRSNRGHFLEHTITELLPEYPMGAGLCRWGMMHSYFGDKTALASAPIWVEIQPTGWLLDGGLPLVLVYYAAVLVALTFAYRLAIKRRDALGDLAVLVTAYDLAILANTLSYSPFVGQAGLDFWLLNSCLMTAALYGQRQPAAANRRQVAPA